MTFIGNLLGSAYTYYSKKKKIDALFQAKLLLVVILNVSLLFLLLLANEFLGLKIFKFLFENKWLVITFYIIIFIGLFKYYSKEKVALYVESFELKSKKEQSVWGIITILSAILPPLLFFIVLRIRHPM